MAKVKAMMKKPGVRVAKFDMCMFNLCSPGSELRMKKRTSVMTNSMQLFEALDGRFCDGTHGHEAIQGSANGQKRSVAAQVYTEEFCETVCKAVIS